MSEKADGHSGGRRTSDRKLKFMLFVGPIGAGKTTLRRQQCKDGFVNIDASEMFVELSGGGEGPFPGPFETELDALGSQVAGQALRERKDVAMEVLGDSVAAMELMASGLSSIGYDLEVVAVTCDVEEALERHNRACETDRAYLSAYFTQGLHLRWVLAALRDLATTA